MTLTLTDHQAKYLAHELSRRYGAGDAERLTGALADAQVDLNPHQVDAALFAFRSATSQGVLIADEVGLGKTIEAGLVLAQHWAERRRRLLVIVPANLRKQWLLELEDKFALPCLLLEKATWDAARRDGAANPFEQDRIVICSYQFAADRANELRRVRWDLAVLDEAHRVRNVYRSGNRMARALQDGLRGTRKLLLTATPLQNNLVELYGLVSFIDEHVFADARSFQEQYGRARGEARLEELKERIRPFCHRTLRRQVLPYVRYTARRAMLQTFTPTGDESALYDMVSEYLRRDDLAAIPTAQRALTTMVLRKLLASSSFAIAGALEKMTGRMATELGGASRTSFDPGDLAEDYDTLDETIDAWSGAKSDPVADPSPALAVGDAEPDAADPDGKRLALRQEFAELASFRDLARGITDNAKGDALLIALRRGFEEMGRLGAPRKAIVFTESRRTQDYLLRLLAASEFGDGVVLFNGANSDPRMRAIYDAWLARHRGTDRVSGSRSADMRSALVEYFRDEGQIMVATEAGAEGINLQFCSLVVNYDLPWNPQRIEQRIGRCHRYGQQHDVVVVNFLNEANAADARVLELLTEKFSLFQGVFGASDEVLGTLGAGIDFERQIAGIYRECRTTSEISAAFDRLQDEMSEEISEAVTRTRASVLEHLDEEVTERLRQVDQDAPAAIGRREQRLLRLTRHELRDVARFTGDHGFTLPHPLSTADGLVPAGTYAVGRGATVAAADHHYRLGGALAQHVIAAARGRALTPATITFDYDAQPHLISELRRRRGQRGWLRATLLAIEGAVTAEDQLLVAAFGDDGEPMDEGTAAQLLGLAGRSEGPVVVDGLTEARLVADIDQLAAAAVERTAQRNQQGFLEEIAKLDAWAQDRRLSLRVSIKDLDEERKHLHRQLRLAGSDMAEVLRLKRLENLLQQRIEDREQELRTESRRILAQQNDLLADIERKLRNDSSQEHLFDVRWEIA